MNIIYILKENLLEIISFIILIGAMIFAFVNIYSNPLSQYDKTINTLGKSYIKEAQVYTIRLIDIKNEEEKNKEGISEFQSLNTVPKLLSRINNTCKAPRVVIRTLNPDSINPFKFELVFISNYFNFLTVLSEFEKLNININKIDMKPYEISGSKANSRHIITLNIEAINGGELLAKNEVDFLNTELNKKRKRDPFQRFAKIGKSIKRLVDLTWLHKLSGIGKINGKFVATINHRIYYENSEFNGMKVTRITPKGVRLNKKTQNGIVNYILNFRSKKEGEK